MGMYVESNPETNTKFVGTYGVAKDISDRKKAEETIYHQAYHDLLTGLPNRLLSRIVSTSPWRRPSAAGRSWQ